MNTTAAKHTSKVCIKCRYDLRGLDPSGNCPECGDPITRACIGCLLDLRRLDPKGYCPRCGVPITPVPDEQRLHNADPDWLATIDRALTLVRWGFFGVLIGFAATFLSVVPALVNSLVAPIPSWVSTVLHALAIGGVFVWLISWLPIFNGLWRLATPEPKFPSGLEPHGRALRVLTVLAIPALVLPPVILYSAILTARLSGLTFLSVVMWSIEVACMIVLVSHAMLFVRLLENLERRAGRLRANRARVLAQYRKAPLGFALLALVSLVASVSMLYSTPVRTPFSTFPLSGLVPLVWFLSLGLVGKTRLAIRQDIADPEGAYVVHRETLPTA